MQAASLYRSAAIQGLADAQNRLGMCYDSGVGVAKDESEAVKWFKLAANQNLPAGQYNLGDCYKRGYVVQSITCAHYRPRQPPLPTYTCITTNIAAAACSNTCSDCFAYDLSNNLSHNVAINFINTTTNIVTNYVCKAKSVLLSRACTCTRVYLACIHSTGPCSSLKLVHVLMSTLPAYTPQVRVPLSSLYMYSCLLPCLQTLHRTGVEKNDVEALRLFRLAAEQGDEDALYNVGVFHQSGTAGVTKDEREAVKLYRLAANRGHPLAQVNLGWCLECGVGVEKNVREAVELYKAAADQGNAFALHILAECYQDGYVHFDISRSNMPS
jgi:TPR repeat protein